MAPLVVLPLPSGLIIRGLARVTLGQALLLLRERRRRLSLCAKEKPKRRRGWRYLSGPSLPSPHMKIEKKFRKDLEAWRWGFDMTIAGRRIRQYDCLTMREAKDAVASLLTEARAIRYGMITPRPAVTLDQLYVAIEQDRTIKDLPKLLSHLDGFIQAVGHEKQLVDLARADWKKYLAVCHERELKPGTINRYLGSISSALHSAPEHFPALGEWQPPRAPWEQTPMGRDRVLSREEIARLLSGLRSDRLKHERSEAVVSRYEVYDLFRLMLLTAAREGELLKLKQSAISWDWKTVMIDATKTKTRRVIPLSEGALEILRIRKSNASRVFKPITKDALYNALRRAAEIAEVPYGDRVAGGWLMYDLRHTAATVIENDNVPYSAVAAILGHKRKDQTATYTHAQSTSMRRGIESLESWCREIDGFFYKPKETQVTVRKPHQKATG